MLRIGPTALSGLMLLAVAACGSPAPAPTGTPAATPTASPAPSRPSDPAQAVTQAAARTATFRDVKFDVSGTLVNATQSAQYTGSTIATMTPPRIDRKNTAIFGGKAVENIEDLTAHTFCTFPQGGPNQRFPNQTTSAATVDPFYDIVHNGSGWAYLADVRAPGGATWWQVLGSYHQDSPPGVTFQLSTITVFIDAASGRIAKTVEHAKLTDDKGAMGERSTTDEHFVYDTGLTVAAC